MGFVSIRVVLDRSGSCVWKGLGSYESLDGLRVHLIRSGLVEIKTTVIVDTLS